jgi:hypothetical protein
MILQEWLFKRHLNEDEKILYVGHKHWIQIFKMLFINSFFGVLFPFVLYFVFTNFLFLILAIVCTTITYSILFYELIDWYLDAVLVTNESIIFVKWNGFFHHESNRLSYESLESISTETKGFLSYFLKFGILGIERDAAPEIVMKNINNPKKLEIEIMKGKEFYEEKNMSENTDALHNILSEMVSAHIKKHGWKKK